MQKRDVISRFFRSLGVGDVHGDAIRNIYGRSGSIARSQFKAYITGAFGVDATTRNTSASGSSEAPVATTIDASKIVPVANQNQPRAWGSLGCVYLGLAS